MSTPGLDPAQLRALRAPARDLARIRTRIEAHLEDNDGYVAFSGGKDSLVVLALAVQVDRNVPVVFFDSGLEFPETYAYIAGLAEQWQLNLDVVPADPPLLDLLAANGTWDHHASEHTTPDLHEVLIAGPARKAHQVHGSGELWGVRAVESRGRRAAYSNALAAIAGNCRCCPTGAERSARHGGVIVRVDGTTVYGPVWDWSTDEVWTHIAVHGLPLNPVYAKLRRLGAGEHAMRISHVIDASHLESGRIVWLKRGWPDLYERIRRALPRVSEYL